MLKLLKSPIVIVLVTFFTIIFYISLSKTQQKNETIAQQIKNIADENQELRSANTVLEEKLSSINQEQIIRDEFLLKKDGEYVVKIPPPPVQDQETKSQEPKANWQQWWQLIF